VRNLPHASACARRFPAADVNNLDMPPDSF
jgi:hypothetical protein